jgi:hypothetical protein
MKKNGLPKLFNLFMVKLVKLTAEMVVRGLATVSLFMFNSSDIILRAYRPSRATISWTFAFVSAF